jgi:hypothetical protein
MRRKRLLLFFVMMLIALAAAPSAALAQRTLDITVNKAELLRFDRHPGSVLVVNPAIADVVADGGDHVFVLGKTPGETQLFVLDEAGKTMMQATVRVGTPAAGQVSVFRGTAETTLNCAPRCAGPQGGAPAAAPAAAPAPMGAAAPPVAPSPTPPAASTPAPSPRY